MLKLPATQQGWNNAQDHCMEHTETGAQLAIPHSQDDGHYMKNMERVDEQVWVGKLFESSWVDTGPIGYSDCWETEKVSL